MEASLLKVTVAASPHARLKVQAISSLAPDYVFFYLFNNLTDVSMVMCGVCAKMYDVCKQSTSNVSAYMYRHWRMHEKHICENGKKYSAIRPSQSQIENVLRTILRNETIAQSTQSVVLWQGMYDAWPALEKIVQKHTEDVDLCDQCFCVYSSNCCRAGRKGCLKAKAYVVSQIPLAVLPDSDFLKTINRSACFRDDPKVDTLGDLLFAHCTAPPLTPASTTTTTTTTSTSTTGQDVMNRTLVSPLAPPDFASTTSPISHATQNSRPWLSPAPALNFQTESAPRSPNRQQGTGQPRVPVIGSSVHCNTSLVSTTFKLQSTATSSASPLLEQPLQKRLRYLGGELISIRKTSDETVHVTDDGTHLVLTSKAEPNNLGSALHVSVHEDLPLKVKNQTLLEFEKLEEVNLSTNDDALVKLYFSADKWPSAQKRNRYAEMSAPMDSSQLENTYLIEASWILVEKAYEQVRNAPSGLLSLVSMLPVIPLSTVRPVEQTRSATGTNDYFMSPTLTTRRVYARLMARVVHVTLEAKLPGYQMIRTVLDGVIQRNRELGSNERVDLLHLIQILYVFFKSLALNEEENIKQYMAPFVFQLVKPRNNREEEEEQDEDGDEDRFSDEEDGGEEAQSTLQPEVKCAVSSISTCKKFACAVLYAFKMCLVLEFMDYTDVAENALATTGIAAIIGDKMEIMKRKLKCSQNGVALGNLLRDLRNMEASSPSTANQCFTRIGPKQELIIDCSAESYDSLDLQRCGQRMFSALRDSFLACLGNDADGNRVWNCITDPQCEELGVVRKTDQKSNGAALPETSEARTLLENAVQGAFDTDIDGTVRFVELLRSAILSSIHLFSSSVARAPELCNLVLHDATFPGNLFFATTYDNVPTLAFFGRVTKTSKEGIAMFPFWLSRLILVYLQVIAPPSVAVLTRELCELAGHESIVQDQRYARFVDNCQAALSHRLAVKPKLSPSFAKEVREHKLSANIGDPSNIYKIHMDEVRSMVVNMLCRKVMTSRLSFAQLRHVLLNAKVNIPTFLDEISKTLSPGDLVNYVKGLMAAATSAIRTFESIKNLGVAGMHSSSTNLVMYQGRVSLGGSLDDKLPQMMLRGCQVIEAGLSALFGRSVITTAAGRREGGAGYIIRDPSPSIAAKIVEQTTVPFDSSDTAREYLLGALGRTFKKQEWINPTQGTIAFDLFTKTKDLGIYLPCGSGKTIAFTLPLSLPPTGFSLYVVPFRCLLDSTIKMMESYGIPCEKLVDKSHPRFSPNAFAANIRAAEDAVRFVVAVADTAVDRSVMEFLRSAVVHGMLNAIVIDEVHQMLVSQNFRPTLKNVAWFGSFRVPLVLVSGTIPACFEATLYNAFGLFPSSTLAYRQDTSYFGRRKVSLVPLGPLEPVQRPDYSRAVWIPEGKVHEYVKDVLCKHAADCTDPTLGRSLKHVLVFSLTKSSNQNLYELLEGNANITNAWILQRFNGDYTEQERKNFLQSFEHYGGPILACVTSAAAEGVDFPMCGLVIVVGGAHGGILALHQMFSRAGRGIVAPSSESSTLPEVMLIFAPRYFLPVLFRKEEKLMDEADKDLTSPFAIGERDEVKSFIGWRSLYRVFLNASGKPLECGGRIMERLVNGKASDSEPCNSCFGCLPLSAWPYPAPPSQKELLRTMGMCDSQGVPGRSPLGGRVEEATETEATEYLNSFTSCCILCRKGGSHYPNHCPVLLEKFNIESWKGNERCQTCFNEGHASKDYARANHLSKDEQYNSDVVTQCAIVTLGCSANKGNNETCFRCFLKHRKDTCPGGKDQHHVRRILIYVWNFCRDAFLSEFSLDRGLTWKDYFRWIVYQGMNGVQNAYLLVAFYKKLRGQEQVAN